MKRLDPLPSWDRRTAIVATLGPATHTPERIRELIKAGVDVMRLNFSHATAEEHTHTFQIVRAIERELGRPVAVLQDLGGPKIRVGRLRGGAVELRDGQTLAITRTSMLGTSRKISTTYPNLPRVVSRGNRLLLNDGTLELVVEDSSTEVIHTRIVRGGILNEHKGINLPGVSLRVPALTAKDLTDLDTGVRLGVDYVALSFVRRAKDITAGRRALAARGARIPIIAKLENADAINALDEIVQAADGVMVARGDLGVELAPERVPILQKTIIHKANAAGIPVITATQMLESMVHSANPTRAEASDVANAILDGTDAVMLSEETAIGDHPIETVQMMDRIARVIESSNQKLSTAQVGLAHTTVSSVARAACALARELRVRAIVVITRTGRTAELLSKHRPQEPLIAFTEEEPTARRLALWWGVNCFATAFQAHTDAMITHVESELIRRKLVPAGDVIVLVGSAPIVARGRTNFLKVHRVRERASPHT